MKRKKGYNETLVYKFILLLIVFIFLNQCSLDTKTGLWTKTQIPEDKNETLEKIFQPKEVLEKEFNSFGNRARVVPGTF